MVPEEIYITTASKTQPLITFLPHELCSTRSVSATNDVNRSQARFARAHERVQKYLTTIITCVKAKADGSSIARAITTHVMISAGSMAKQNLNMGISGCVFIASYGVCVTVHSFQSQIHYIFSRALSDFLAHEGNR
jgi:hypothetical protein